MSDVPCPQSLLGVKTYFLRADELAKGGKPYVAHRLRKFGIELAMKVKGPDAGPYLLRQFDLVDQEKAANIKCPPRKPKPPPAPAPAPAPPPEPAPAPAPEAASTEGGKEGEGKEGEEGGEKKEEGGDEKKEGEKEGEKKKGIGEKVAAAGEKMAISLNLKDSPEKKEKAAAEAAAAEKAAADKAAAEKKAAEEARYPKAPPEVGRWRRHARVSRGSLGCLSPVGAGRTRRRVT
mmetsp:Transcript_1270/g.3409  ORF Transcript_1270/g.3409 Transcript_1270/m.3409 type:complete len:234 (-) Transcript_1270:651-1352(-)